MNAKVLWIGNALLQGGELNVGVLVVGGGLLLLVTIYLIARLIQGSSNGHPKEDNHK